ncbi:chemotaxis protein CheR [Nitrospira sp. KM1]|uniref:CheR family methyltransferase n=1 Tax=Nitrospira sp. KM1 TaxID=1936990 RepID=UPI0013A7792C|nr:CheR family methyltransferase [Nitrospira sp. KM1]BCA56057.1 chemotaxis protein CheR [Nitrospira sp. KM1]
MRDATAQDIELDLLLEAIYRTYDYDFRGYARASIKRRVLQAQERFGCRSLSLLQDRVMQEPSLLPQLLGYLTVQVSDLFRDPEYFLAMRQHVVPHLKTYPSLKVWIAGCSTGEELYSMAILFREEGLEARTLFYATDINSDSLSKAEAGIYHLDRIARFSDNHRASGGTGSLSDYYTAGYQAAVFDKTLRRRTVFSDHSLVSDAVFAEVHVISCRNVLIYFDRSLQDRAVGLLKDALVRRGFLGLGSRENLRFNAHYEDFAEIAGSAKWFQKRGNE